jgi:spore photoproduct lyase
MELKFQKTKTLSIKENGRSSDFVTPNFILSCNAGCTYCYTYRFGRNKVYINTNTDEILSKVKQHAEALGDKIPNQTDSKLWTYDIGCDTDICYHWKDYDWTKVFDTFKSLPNAKAVFATKFVNNQLLKHGSEHLRIRFSLMPQNMADMVEMNTAKMRLRIAAINRFIEHGWDVHVNFSPVIYYKNWEQDYVKLFEELDKNVKYKDLVKSEVIFLTHNKNLHERNLEKGLTLAESHLWYPLLQEKKTSQYGGENLRYMVDFKSELITSFKQLHQRVIPWCKIRYIF